MVNTQEKGHKGQLRRTAKAFPFLSCLSNLELQGLERILLKRRFARNEVVLAEEDTLQFMYFIVSGRVKAVKISDEGNEHILATHGKGEFFGEMGILDGKTAPATVIAMEESQIALIRKRDFDKNLLSNEAILRALILMLCDRLRRSWLKLKIVSQESAQFRVRAFLALFGREHGVTDSRGTIINLKLSHREIAEHTFLSRETVSRHLRRLKAEGEIDILPGKTILLHPLFFRKAPMI